ncbi:hypothetical protein ART_1325 [Arthrobacter sp. PAMC 25486]|uniref:sensor histidine kinase n=1 Tax=Arthrobacter sp. PAMC 25486 TaxID=1494608 RepID=UPI000535B38C|nr:histidine kinase [Arthrobacter sp. PAMC 25486]AIY00924.1 hypothetical protein ART_1325 [Arthrobacter sp. PAMC 25486]
MKIKMMPVGSPWRTVLLVLVVAAADVVFSMALLGFGLENGTVPDPADAGLEWARYGIAPVLAPLGAVALIWRHRFPKTVAAAAAVLGALSFGGIAFFVALFMLARRRLDWWVAAIIALAVAAEMLFGSEPMAWDVALFGALGWSAIAVWGAYRGQRARLRENQVASLKERAEQAEARHAADVERSRLAERHRIAREMHDTLAHRMSLVAVQAAALQVAAPDAETAGSARLIRETAHAALGELRDVLGVLHEDGTAGPAGTARWQAVDPGTATGAPSGGTTEAASNRTAPSGIEQIAGLLEEWRLAGINVDYSPNAELDGVLPDAVSRGAFRVVQEGITNVARHAPGAVSAVRLELHPFEPQEPRPQELQITVSNGPGAQSEPAPGAGLGLVGLAERVQLLGGTLDHGPTGSGFQLVARIPFTKQPQNQRDIQEGAIL